VAALLAGLFARRAFARAASGPSEHAARALWRAPAWRSAS
jgi:hypothetical protein